MISIISVLVIQLIHLFADFLCQTHEMAIGKSKSNYWLSLHVGVYTLVTFLAWHFCLMQPGVSYFITEYLYFVVFIFSTHWVTDYITSRISSKYFTKGDYHNGFVVVGVDQLIHTLQLLTAYYLFIK